MNQTSTIPLPAELATLLLEGLPYPVIVLDNDDVISWCNDVFAETLGLETDQILNQPLSLISKSYLKPSDFDAEVVIADYQGKKNLHYFRCIPYQLNAPIPTAARALYYVDITREIVFAYDLEQLQDKLQDLTTVDRVSGLINYNAMMQILEPLISRSRRYSNPLSVIALEITNFANIETEYGRKTADQAVIGLGHLLKDQMRWADVISRTNDATFILILPETENSAAQHLANKLSDQVAKLLIQEEVIEPISLQVSMGVASWEQGNDSTLLLRKANQQLTTATESAAKSDDDANKEL
jgi:diguanylate cyclase (GGDEF)-like protein